MSQLFHTFTWSTGCVFLKSGLEKKKRENTGCINAVLNHSSEQYRREFELNTCLQSTLISSTFARSKWLSRVKMCTLTGYVLFLISIYPSSEPALSTLGSQERQERHLEPIPAVKGASASRVHPG